MVNFFLRAKHWQLFLLLFALPFVFQFVMFGSIFANIDEGSEPDPTVLFSFFQFFPLIILVPTLVVAGWQWSIVVGLNSKLPEGATVKLGRFKFFIIFPLIYILFLCLGMIMLFDGMMEGGMTEAPEETLLSGMLISFALVIPFHLLSMVCLILAMGSVAKTIKSIEMGKEATVSDYIGEFILVWFNFVGVWILQPKINQWMDTPDELDGGFIVRK
jgi:hypothetical protein